MCDLYSNMFKKSYWTLRQALDAVATHHVMSKRFKSKANAEAYRAEYYDSIFKKFEGKVYGDDGFVDVLDKIIVHEYFEQSDEEYDPSIDYPLDEADNRVVPNYETSLISPKKFINWCIEREIDVPDAFVGFVNGTLDAPVNVEPSVDAVLSGDDKKKLSELKLEKEKWDASIDAAVKVGLLFVEGNLPKPVSKEAFVTEFREQLGDSLPESTIERIYKALPTGYKMVGGRPKKSASEKQGSIDTIIKAAVYAGSIFDSNDAKSMNKLKKSLLDVEYDLPDDEHLKMIIDVVKDV